MTCIYTFKRGANVGKPCGKKCVNKTEYCKLHTGSKQMFLEMLPNLAQGNIIESIIEHHDPHDAYTKLRLLSCASKYWHEFIKEYWDKLYSSMNLDASQKQLMDEYSLSILQRLALYFECGCQKCGTPRITKIHWPFPIRVCKDCFQSITISDYRLYNDYKINNSLANLNYVSTTLWNRYIGNYNLNFYLISDVEKILECKLHVYVQNKLESLQNAMSTELNISKDELYLKSPYYKILKHYDTVQGFKNAIQKDLRIFHIKELVNSLGINHELAYEHSRKYKKLYTKIVISGDYKELENINIGSINNDVECGEEKNREYMENLRKAREIQLENEEKMRLIQLENERKLNAIVNEMIGKQDCVNQHSYKCTICYGVKSFTAQGLRDHTRSKHMG